MCGHIRILLLKSVMREYYVFPAILEPVTEIASKFLNSNLLE
jgi:hypothetical protein